MTLMDSSLSKEVVEKSDHYFNKFSQINVMLRDYSLSRQLIFYKLLEAEAQNICDMAQPLADNRKNADKFSAPWAHTN